MTGNEQTRDALAHVIHNMRSAHAAILRRHSEQADISPQLYGPGTVAESTRNAYANGWADATLAAQMAAASESAQLAEQATSLLATGGDLYSAGRL